MDPYSSSYASMQAQLSPPSTTWQILSTTSRSGTPFGQLLLAVFNSIAQVFLLCAAGYLLAREGVLDKKTQKQINRLNVNLFTPALLFSKVAFYLTPEKLKELWIIPIWFVIVTCSSMLVGRTLGWVAGLRRSQRSFITAASMFMNSNTLPIALMQSLVVSVPDLAWDLLNQNPSGGDGNKDGGGDNKNAMLGRALTYLTMYSTLGMVLRYSYGVSLLSKADTIMIPVHAPSQSDASNHPTTKSKVLPGDDDEHTPLLLSPEQEHSDEESERGWVSHPSSSTLVTHDRDNAVPPIIGIPGPVDNLQQRYQNRHNVSMVSSPASVGEDELLGTAALMPGNSRKRTKTTFYNSFPNSPNDSRLDLSASIDETLNSSDDDGEGHRRRREGDVEENEDEEGLPTHRQHSKSSPSLLRRILATTTQRVAKTLRAIHDFMTVPLYASLLSLIVACAPPLKHGLEHHMQPVNDAMNQAGKCAVPLTLVVLGGYFYTPDEGSDSAKPATRKASSGTRKVKKEKRSFGRKIQDWYQSWKENRARRKEEREMNEHKRTRPGETKTIVLAVLSRMVITPLVLLPLMVWATKSDWHVVFDDPVFITTNVILLCSPPALTLAQITAQVSGDAFERLISGTIFWSYCLLTPPVMMGCVLLGLWLVKF